MADTEMPESMDLSTQLRQMLLHSRPANGNDRLGEKRQRTETQVDTRHPDLPQTMRTVIQLLLKHEDQLQSINKQDSFIFSPHQEKPGYNLHC